MTNQNMVIVEKTVILSENTSLFQKILFIRGRGEKMTVCAIWRGKIE
jgi:hypothetical protein